jgi:hypothetical protein
VQHVVFGSDEVEIVAGDLAGDATAGGRQDTVLLVYCLNRDNETYILSPSQSECFFAPCLHVPYMACPPARAKLPFGQLQYDSSQTTILITISEKAT